MGVTTQDNPYSEQIQAGAFGSFPCICRAGTKDWEIVKNVELDDTAKKYLDLTNKEMFTDGKDVEAFLSSIPWWLLEIVHPNDWHPSF